MILYECNARPNTSAHIRIECSRIAEQYDIVNYIGVECLKIKVCQVESMFAASNVIAGALAPIGRFHTRIRIGTN